MGPHLQRIVQLLGRRPQGGVLQHAPRDEVAKGLRTLLRHPTRRGATITGRIMVSATALHSRRRISFA